MSLPIKAIDRLFERLSATYGTDWTRSWASPEVDVKTAWAYELSRFADRLEAIAWALDNLPERCPNVIEFRNLARRAPMPEAPRLAEPAADPLRMAAELDKLRDIKTKPLPVRENKDWARRIIDRSNAGERIAPCTLRFANEALARPQRVGA